MTTYRSSSKNTRIMNMQPILNKIHQGLMWSSEFDVLVVAKKLVKYVVHSSKREEIFKNISLLIECPNKKRLILVLKDFRG
jgi:hypothetical protein